MASGNGGFTKDHGAIVRGDSTRHSLALVFTGDEFGEGGETIARILREENIKASFFLTGNFYRNRSFQPLIRQLKKDGHYLGSHSDRHLLYCDWNKRDSLLLSKQQFKEDLAASYREMEKFGIARTEAPFFLPPYEWYNDSIAAWTAEEGLRLINYSPGTGSNADYTWPGLKNYKTSDEIFRSILAYEKAREPGLNGFLLLLHIGTGPARTDKFYNRLTVLVHYLKGKKYSFKTVNQLLLKGLKSSQAGGSIN